MDKFFGLDSVSKCDENMDLLVTVHDPICLAIYTDILRVAGIPYLVKERGAGGCVKVITGYTMFGSDVFVLKDDLGRAKELIVLPGELGEPDADGEDAGE